MKNDLSIRDFRGLAIAILLVVIAVGVVRIPGARADAPICRYKLNPDTVIDNETALVWQRNADGVLRTWDDAVLYCTNLNIDGNEWRLPTPPELHTLIDETRKNPAIDQTAFPSTALDFYWSTSYAGDSTYGWMMEFGSGITYTALKTDSHIVRCVR